MSSPFTTRDATIDDLDAISTLEFQMFVDDAWSRAMMREELTADHRVYLALTDEQGVVCGYGGVLIVGDESDIQTIAIAPAARGKGQGRAMMLSLLGRAAAQGATSNFLEVRADNVAARALYESLGYQEIGVRPGYYQPGNVDAIVMRLEMGDRA